MLKRQSKKRIAVNIAVMTVLGIGMSILLRNCSAHASELDRTNDTFSSRRAVRQQVRFDVTCRNNNCKEDGFTLTMPDSPFYSQENICIERACFQKGYISIDTRGVKVTITCRTPGCLMSGWDIRYPNNALYRSVICRDGDCSSRGWLIEIPNGEAIGVNCIDNDCDHNGFWNRAPDGHIIQTLCKEHDCYTFGWITNE